MGTILRQARSLRSTLHRCIGGRCDVTTNHCDMLRFDVTCGIIESYRVYGKDGYNDRYGKTHDTRGGGRSSTDARRDSQAAFEARQVARLQSGRTMARQPIRTQDVSGRAKKERNQRELGTHSIGFQIAHPLPNTFARQ